MKSAIFSIIPLMGFAAAQQGCTRSTVTKTETEKTYVTVTPSLDVTSTVDITITKTIDITTTITVRPSSSVEATATGLHWGNYPNGTYSNHTVRPHPHRPSSVSLDYTSSAVTETPASTYAPGQGYGSPSETSEAAIPTSETPAAAESLSAYEAPAASSIVKAVKAQATSAAGSRSGEATHYGGNTSGGTCSFTGYTIPSSLFGTALSDSNWDTAAHCGACVSVTGPLGNKITAMIVDQCPGCGTNHLDLYENGYTKLAGTDPKYNGIMPVSWDFVPCGISSPIVLKNKSGTSPYWFSMQVQNANVAVASLEVSIDGGKTWSKATRQTYNYFENASGYGTETVDVKVTSTSGESIIVKNVSIAENTTKTAASNFS